MSDYSVDVIEAKCGCKFLVCDTSVGWEAEPGSGVFELVAEIPDLEPPETPTAWARENVIAPHEDACLEMAGEEEVS